MLTHIALTFLVITSLVHNTSASEGNRINLGASPQETERARQQSQHSTRARSWMEHELKRKERHALQPDDAPTFDSQVDMTFLGLHWAASLDVLKGFAEVSKAEHARTAQDLHDFANTPLNDDTKRETKPRTFLSKLKSKLEKVKNAMKTLKLAYKASKGGVKEAWLAFEQNGPNGPVIGIQKTKHANVLTKGLNRLKLWSGFGDEIKDKADEMNANLPPYDTDGNVNKYSLTRLKKVSISYVISTFVWVLEFDSEVVIYLPDPDEGEGVACPTSLDEWPTDGCLAQGVDKFRHFFLRIVGEEVLSLEVVWNYDFSGSVLALWEFELDCENAVSGRGSPCRIKFFQAPFDESHRKRRLTGVEIALMATSISVSVVWIICLTAWIVMGTYFKRRGR